MRDDPGRTFEVVVATLVALYEEPFGGKPRGRFRISMKLMCRIFGRRRVWPEQVEAVRRRLYERGYQLIDMETYFVVVSQQTFASYRRVNEASIAAASGAPRTRPAPAARAGKAG